MAQITGVLEQNLQKNVLESKVLMVGAGGIGCELLKNLVLTGNTKNIIISSALNYYYLIQASRT